jgi:asparagine synthase (glutamine-hydrolysing)
VFLSAGIDSSVIACTAAELGIRPKTITLAFEDYLGTAADEAPIAEMTAKLIGADHRTVRLSRSEIDEVLDSFFERMDLPTIDGLNTFLVSYAARQSGLKVALSGLGADEIFGGYPSFAQVPQLLRAGRRLRRFGHIAVLSADAIARSAAALLSWRKLSGTVRYSDTLARAFFLRRCLHLEEDLRLLLDASWIERGLPLLQAAQIAQMARLPRSPLRAQIATLELTCYMRNQLLRDSDWAGMAHGVEIRVPFIDRVLMSKLAPAVASDRPPTKQDLASASSLLPPNVARRKKTGFTTPVAMPGRASAPASLRNWSAEVHRKFHPSSKLSNSLEHVTA